MDVAEILKDPRVDKGCFRLVANYESLDGYNAEKKRYFPYHCEADRDGLMTVGRGKALLNGEKFLTIGGVKCDLYKDGLTIEQVDRLYSETMAPRLKTVFERIPHAKPHEYGALLSLFYNVETPLLGGTVDDLHNAGAPKTAVAAKILEYHKANKKPVRGLWRRRGVEALYYLTGDIFLANTPETEAAVFRRLAALGVKFKTPVFPTPKAKKPK